MRRLKLQFISVSVVAVAAASSQAAFAADEGTSATSGDIVVTARREKTARIEQQIAPNLVNIQAAETIAK